MLITILVVVGTILCFVIGLLCLNSYSDFAEGVGAVSLIFSVLGLVASILCCIIIIGNRVNSEGQLAAYQTEREILEYRLDQKEYLNDNNVGMTELMKDITEYNSQLAEAQYGLHNPWTSWFYGDYVDELTPIILDDVD